MAKKNKYNIRSSEFHDYFEGKLSNRERNAFERKMQKDLFNMDAADGFALVTREEAEEDLAYASRKIRQRIHLRRRIGWYSAAATLAAILTITTIFLAVDNDPDSQDKRIREMNKVLENTYVEESEAITTEKDDSKGNLPDAAREIGKKGDEKDPEVDKIATVPATAEEKIEEEVLDKVAEESKEKNAVEETVFLEEKEEQAQAIEIVDIGEGAEVMADQAEIQEFEMDIAEEKIFNVADEFEQEVSATEIAIKREVEMPAQAAASPEKSARMAKGRAVTEQISTVSSVPVSMDAEPQSTIQQAVPVPGMTAYKHYIDTSLVFPATELSRSEAIVDLKFYILPDGRPDDIQVVLSPSGAFSDEAQRVIENGPLWIPASKDGLYNNSILELRINFNEKHKK